MSQSYLETRQASAGARSEAISFIPDSKVSIYAKFGKDACTVKTAEPKTPRTISF